MKKAKKNLKTKAGVASFYVVVFATLILVVIAMSFVAVIVSEMTRSSNDDLAQSAYDSALAGIEDAKMAFYKYRQALAEGVTAEEPRDDGYLSGNEVVWYMENPDCDMVGHALGKLTESQSGEDTGGVLVQEDANNAMQQAYTCVKTNSRLGDYRATLTSESPMKVVLARLDVEAKYVKYARVSWYIRDGSDLDYRNYSTSKGVTFPAVNEDQPAMPPTISVGFVQTAETFTMAQFDMTASGKTNRATVYLAPVSELGDSKIGASRTESEAHQNDKAGNYIGVWDGEQNKVSVNQVVKTNDRAVKNLPYGVYCDPDGTDEFLCQTIIELPEPIDGTRNNETFAFVFTLPDGQPSTEIALELCTNADDEYRCLDEEVHRESGNVVSDRAKFRDIQLAVDSTGRANDLYKRVEARIDTIDYSFPYPMYALELLGGDGNGDTLLEKRVYSTVENSIW